MPEAANSEHYFIFKHGTASVANTAWTKAVWKNGTLDTSREVAVQFQAVDTNVYVVSFTDDGADQCAWDISIDDGTDYYTAHFYVERDTVRKHLSALLQNLNQGLSFELREFKQALNGVVTLLKSIPQSIQELKNLIGRR